MGLQKTDIILEEKKLAMTNHNYMDPAKMAVDAISNLHSNNVSMYPKPGLSKEERVEVEDQSNKVFEEIRKGNLDFIVDTMSSHIIILSNITAVCNRKAKSGDYFKEFTELSLKASDQLRKSGLALAQIKKVIVNIENNLTIQQQNNLLQLNQVGQDLCNCNPIPELTDVKKVV